MGEPMLPLLCGNWMHDPARCTTVKFNTDGTGELYCRMEFQVFIAAEFHWKTQSNVNLEKLELPATIDIDMTLTKRNMKNANVMKGEVLEETAYQTKQYRLQVEKGVFLVEGRTTYRHNPTYEYRLLWDKSPYPPLNEWKEEYDAAKLYHFWERKDFFQREIKGQSTE